jgi:ATP adenylyltransferase
MNNILYSPWRLNYILTEKDKKCIFCFKPLEDNDKDHLILFRSDYSFVIMNLYPYNNGHLMVVPNRHVSRLEELSSEEISDLFNLLKKTERVINKVYHPDGLNIGMNIGKAAGAGIDDHLHVHIIPRWNGDCNFMTCVNSTRVIPESFDLAYIKLKEEFDNADY